MDFYQQISRYYDDIFPVSKQSLDFYKKLFQEHQSRSVLDVACGSGGYLLAFSQWGMEAIGVDLDPSMVSSANKKAEESGTAFHALEADMRSIPETISQSFDAVICMGNSLVHLSSTGEMEHALSGFYQLTNNEGLLTIQVINYDRILDEQVDELPPIENPTTNLKFTRKYHYQPSEHVVHFNTLLEVGPEKYENSIPLYPLRKDELKTIISQAGYDHPSFYGDFKGSAWSPGSYATIAIARKG